MVTIGVISDTHGLLRAEALDALAGSELIIHAGDVLLVSGTQEAVDRLMVRFNVGCRIEETLHVRKLDEDFFVD